MISIQLPIVESKAGMIEITSANVFSKANEKTTRQVADALEDFAGRSWPRGYDLPATERSAARGKASGLDRYEA